MIINSLFDQSRFILRFRHHDLVWEHYLNKIAQTTISFASERSSN